MRAAVWGIAAAACASAWLFAGCVGELNEIVDNPDQSGQVDLGTDAVPVEMGPSGLKFFPDIQNDLDSKLCANPGCHAPGNNMPTFVKMPTVLADEDANYTNFKTVALNFNGTTDPTQSQLLKALLPGGGHGGGIQLTSTSDPVYLRWLTWIKDGGPR